MTTEELFEQLNNEDTIYYEGLIKHINSEKMELHEVKKYLRTLIATDVSRLTTTQLTLMRCQRYRSGYTLYWNMYGPSTNGAFYEKFKGTTNINTFYSDVRNTAKENLKYLTSYEVNQWRKENGSPSTKKVRGSSVVIAIDAFSLTIFKGSITKPFLRTEAKNYIVKVNSAFESTSKSITDVSIRNKFYAAILDNTPVQTKALLNAMVYTPLILDDGSCYQPDPDEAIVVEVDYGNNDLLSLNTPDCAREWSGDTALVSHSVGLDSERDNNRLAGAASILMTMFVKSNNETYKTLAIRMLSVLPADIKTSTLNLTTSICEVREVLLKEIK